MNRRPRWHYAVLALAASFLSGSVAFAVTQTGPEIIPTDAHCVEVGELDTQAWLCTLPFDETTTTTSTSTTTTPATTTTTPTTTTTAPPSDLTIPETLPYSTQLQPFGGYDIIASNGDTGQFWWRAPYLGSNLPYKPGSAWIAGDREHYACAYGFLEDDGEIVGRFTFVRPPGQGYGRVLDKFMDEAERYYDGSPYPGPEQEIIDEDCQTVAVSSGVDYDEEYFGPDQRPRVGFFNSDDQILDIRDYTNTTANVIFRLFSFDGTRATVVAYENGLAAMIVYYDALGSGQLAVDFNGIGPFAFIEPAP